MIVRNQPFGSALDRTRFPDSAMWNLSEQLLAAVFDQLRVANWQRGGGNQRDKPKPLPRPGVEPDSVSIGAGPIPMDEMAAFLGWDDPTKTEV